MRGSAIRFSNMPLWFIIAEAYEVGIRFDAPEVSRFKLFAGGRALTPIDAIQDKVFGARYDIVANVPQPVPLATQAAMLRTLLAERFHLKIHTETRQQGAYQLRVAQAGKLGPALKSSPHDCTAYRMAIARGEALPEPRDNHDHPLCGQGGFDVVNERWAGPMPQLIAHLQQFVDGVIADATDLRGYYEWDVSFPRFVPGPNGGRELTSTSTVNDALQDALGLKLVRVTAPIEVFVIDSVEAPTPD
jgi:uncharacterized protein (TIGR03435 family)